MDNIETCHVKCPKNYCIVRFEFSLVRHAEEVNSVLRVRYVRPKIDDRNEYFKVGYLIVFFFE